MTKQEEQDIKKFGKPHKDCDWCCLYHCTEGFKHEPSCKKVDKQVEKE